MKYVLCTFSIFFVCTNQEAMGLQKRPRVCPGTPLRVSSDQLKSYAELDTSPRESEPVIVKQGNQVFWGVVQSKVMENKYIVVHQTNGNRAKGAIHTRDTLYKLNTKE